MVSKMIWCTSAFARVYQGSFSYSPILLSVPSGLGLKSLHMTLPLLFPLHFLLSNNKKSVPPCKLQGRPSTDFNRNTCLQGVFKSMDVQRDTSICSSNPFVISALSVFFLNFTVYHFLNSYPCPLHNGFSGSKLKSYTRCDKRPEITQVGKFQFA